LDFYIAKLQRATSSTLDIGLCDDTCDYNTVLLDGKQDYVTLISDDDGFEKIVIKNTDFRNVEIVKAESQLQIWEKSSEKAFFVGYNRGP